MRRLRCPTCSRPARPTCCHPLPQLFPEAAARPADQVLPFPAGLTSVTARWGDFLNNVQDAGGWGAANGSAACPPGQAVTGLQVAVSPMRLPPYSFLLTGLLVTCSAPGAPCL